MVRKTKQPSQGINSHYEENQLTTDNQEHSLQTGKCIQRAMIYISSIQKECFNSFQTGSVFKEIKRFLGTLQGHSIFKLSESRIIAEDAEDADFRV